MYKMLDNACSRQEHFYKKCDCRYPTDPLSTTWLCIIFYNLLPTYISVYCVVSIQKSVDLAALSSYLFDAQGSILSPSRLKRISTSRLASHTEIEEDLTAFSNHRLDITYGNTYFKIWQCLSFRKSTLSMISDISVKMAASSFVMCTCLL